MKLRPSLLWPMLLMSATACSSLSGDKLKSDWAALKDAESLSCKELPLKKEDLRIDRVHVIPDLGPSMILEVISRRGVRSFYHLPFGSLGRLDEESLVPLPVSQDSIFLGAGISGGHPIFVLRTTDKSKAVIQVRDLTNNALLQQYPVEVKANWELGPWTLEKGILRALVREEKNDESIDDQPYLQLEVNTQGKGAGNLRPEATQAVIGQAGLFNDSLGSGQILWLDRGTSEKVQNEPRHRVLAWKAGPKETAMEVEDKGRVESWTFLEAYDHSLIAMIKGDSLLWENASIDMTRLSKVKPFTKEAQISLPLSRVHVAQPLLTLGPKGEYLLIPQWLDHELTVAVYSIEDKEAKPKGYAGTFKEGTSFHQAFYHEPSKEFYLLAKGPGSLIGRYNLCSVDL